MILGFIGLGNMGRPMATNLQRKGFDLVVHDVNAAPMRALEVNTPRPTSRVPSIALFFASSRDCRQTSLPA